MEEALRALLLAGLSDMTAERVNWGSHPQDMPANAPASYIVLHLVGLNRGRTQQGADGIDTSRVQIDAYAPDFITARDLGTGIINHLDFHCGGGFEAIFFDTARLTREGGSNPGDGLCRASLDFIIHWRTSHVG
ncbi:hypothetical protein [Paracoccus sp. SM22M-07]|uniref:hypothetical protein n=1 Tax=Paracoccus sp. SM22M-07 TaxID=1520813 RepID=UPI000920909F|nr:hypothetical protein [Paracoccus sp. SM22M-07]OJH43970.1 hypothetical protein IE00_13855 [Paracoccus sp. SM22M-07]